MIYERRISKEEQLMRLKEGEKSFINYRNCDDEELICLAYIKN